VANCTQEPGEVEANVDVLLCTYRSSKPRPSQQH
jgi:hypothetical protein